MKKKVQFITLMFRMSIIVPLVLSQSSCHNEESKGVAEEYDVEKSKAIEKEKDLQFLVSAAEINLEEVRLGQLAQKNSLVNEVKELGKVMQEIHLKSLTGLTTLAKKKSVAIPTAPTDDAQEAYRSLKSKTGIDFNVEYCDMVVGSHKDAITVFEKISNNQASDEDIRKWAKVTLADLRKHLDLAIVCQQKCEKM